MANNITYLPIKSNEEKFRDHFEVAVLSLLRKDVIDLAQQSSRQKTQEIAKVVKKVLEPVSPLYNHTLIENFTLSRLHHHLADCKKQIEDGRYYTLIRKDWERTLEIVVNKISAYASTTECPASKEHGIPQETKYGRHEL